MTGRPRHSRARPLAGAVPGTLLAAFVSVLPAAPGAGTAEAEASLRLHFDGAHQVFTLVTEGGRSGFTRFAALDAVSIEGQDGPARLVVEITLPAGADSGASPWDARISFRPQGFRDYWVSPPAFPEGGIVIDQLALSGPAPWIAGRFDVPLCFTRSPLHPPDPARCLPASGQFDTPLVAGD